MMSVEDWASKIAAEVSPNETDFAPLWAEAFVQGGKARRELFAQTNAQASGFLPGALMPALPVILKAIEVAGPPLLAMLTSDMTKLFLEAVKNALFVGEVFGKARSWFTALDKQTVETTPADKAVYAKLNEIMSKLDKEVRSLGLDQAKCDRINLTVLQLLLENPPDATQFVQKLTERK